MGFLADESNWCLDACARQAWTLSTLPAFMVLSSVRPSMTDARMARVLSPRLDARRAR